MGGQCHPVSSGLATQAGLVQARLDDLLPLRDVDRWSHDHSSSCLIMDGEPRCACTLRGVSGDPLGYPVQPIHPYILISDSQFRDMAGANADLDGQ
jgi:hypothetical protein